ncbi:MAG: hypothetical protein WCF67_21795, partial [Chitinophagaceae bacterium]
QNVKQGSISNTIIVSNKNNFPLTISFICLAIAIFIYGLLTERNNYAHETSSVIPADFTKRKDTLAILNAASLPKGQTKKNSNIIEKSKSYQDLTYIRFTAQEQIPPSFKNIFADYFNERQLAFTTYTSDSATSRYSFICYIKSKKTDVESLAGKMIDHSYTIDIFLKNIETEKMCFDSSISFTVSGFSTDSETKLQKEIVEKLRLALHKVDLSYCK